MALNGNLDPTSPNGVATANFTLARRGYEPEEVRAFLREVSDEVARLHNVNAQLEHRIAEASANVGAPQPRQELDEATIISMLGEDTARVLSTAREAAAQMRSRAEENVARMLREAQDTAARIRQEADLDAAKRREDAAAVAHSEMEHAKQEGRRMVGEARAVRERILADLVRRRDAGRQQLDQLHGQKQKMLTMFAQTRSQLLDTINGLGPNEPEQEVVSTALDEEMALAGKAYTLDHENDGDSSSLQPPAGNPFAAPSPFTPASSEGGHFPLASAGSGDSTSAAHEVTTAVATVVLNDDSAEAPVAEAQTVMTLPPPAPAEMDTMVWLRSLSDVAMDETPASGFVTAVETVPAVEPEPVAEVVPVVEEPEVVEAPAAETVEVAEPVETVEVEAVEVVEEPSQTYGIFQPPVDMLRAEVMSWHAPDDAASLVEAKPAKPAEPAATPVTPVVAEEPVATVEPVASTDVTAEQVRPSADDLFARIRTARSAVVAQPASDEAPVSAAESVIARRSAVLDPIEQSIARRLKRTMADEQNEVFDRLRRHADLPAAESLVGSLDEYSKVYRNAVESDLRTAIVEGALSIGGMSDIDLKASIEKHQVLAECLEELVGEIAAPLHARLVRGIEQSSGDPAEASDILRAIYREWKTQRIDAAAGHLALAAYGRGAYAAVVPGSSVCWVVDPSHTPCADADDNVLGGTVCAGEPFPTGHLRAPAYPGCRCAIAPTDQ
jgi:DivIVA domain-containing protein